MTNKQVSVVNKVFARHGQAPPYVLDNGVKVYGKFDLDSLKLDLIDEIREAFWNNRDIQEILLGDYINPKLTQSKEKS